MVSSNQKFLFDTSFEGAKDPSSGSSDSFADFLGNSIEPQEEPSLEAVEPEEVPLPEGAVSLEDMEIAKQSAYAEGFAAGQIEAQNHAVNTAETMVAQSISTLAQQLASLQINQKQQIQELQSVSMDVALRAIQKLFPSLVHSTSLEEITVVFRECLDRLPQEPRLVIRVSDITLDEVQEKLEHVAQQSGFNGHLVFLSEPGMPAGDVRVEWAEGGAERNNTEMLEEIDTIISRAITSLSQPGDSGQTSAISETSESHSAPAEEVAQ